MELVIRHAFNVEHAAVIHLQQEQHIAGGLVLRRHLVLRDNLVLVIHLPLTRVQADRHLNIRLHIGARHALLRHHILK